VVLALCFWDLRALTLGRAEHGSLVGRKQSLLSRTLTLGRAEHGSLVGRKQSLLSRTLTLAQYT